MKNHILASLSIIASHLSAQTIRSVDGRVAQLPQQFAVSEEGIKWMQPGAAAPILVKWDRIDLAALARDEPKIEQARQQAILSKKEVFISTPPKPNYYREFLSQSINVQFQQKWKAVSSGRVDYDISTTGYVDYNTGGFSANSKVTGRTSETTKYIDQTRPSLNTTVEELLLKLGEDDKIDTHRLIQDLRESGSVLQNLNLLFSSLAEAYPDDYEIGKAKRALDRLIAERATSVDAMRQLKAFALHARNKSK
jgi:hypothetical protein